jgi:hypothetical protein
MAILKKYTEIKGTDEVLYVARIPKGMADALDGVIEAFAPSFDGVFVATDKTVGDLPVSKKQVKAPEPERAAVVGANRKLCSVCKTVKGGQAFPRGTSICMKCSGKRKSPAPGRVKSLREAEGL